MGGWVGESFFSFFLSIERVKLFYLLLSAGEEEDEGLGGWVGR